MTNPAALQGWVKSTDPKSGRTFYANHITRKTQWEAPEGWVDDPPPPAFGGMMDDHHHGGGSSLGYEFDSHKEEKEEPLPSNWEELHDPTTGKPFYVDHERKITTWVRPKPERKSTGGFGSAGAAAVSLQPAPNSGGLNSAALARILSQQPAASTSSLSGRSYDQESSYYHNFAPSSHRSEDVDLSDSLPPLEFTVKKVADALRPNCPHCGLEFTMSKRRHHCRLCGDVFCDACSSHRVELPLEGPEFEKPVRVCNFCKTDVDIGNFFSLRRYLTPLHLYNGSKHAPGDGGVTVTATGLLRDDDGVASPKNVNAALAALTTDLDQWIQTASGQELKNVTIPPEILVPEILKHLEDYETSNRAIRAIASLLALESLANSNQFATAVYVYGGKERLDDMLKILERSGSDRKTLFVQELAVRTMYYLTEAKTIGAVQRKQVELQNDDDVDFKVGGVRDLDLSRTARALLDHASASKNPNLQRWSAATLTNLIREDQRRACENINEVAAVMASGEHEDLSYTSIMDELVNTGGIMILCSCISNDDADTRAHAVGALGATITNTRAIDNSLIALYELSGGRAGRAAKQDGNIIRAIVAGGGCSASVSQLLLSADNQVASMGCAFLQSLVVPLLADPMASAALPSQYDYRTDNDNALAACREAAIEIATDSCLPALLSLVREGNGRRPIDLRKMATETLAAIALTVGLMGQSWTSYGQYEEGLERNGAPSKLKDAILMLNEEGAIDVALEVLQSSAGQTLGSSRETPASRIRESAGIVLGALTYCSAEAIMELQTRQILGPLLLASNDASMTVQSTLRGDAAPRCCGVLEAMSAILMFAWQHPSGASNELLDRLIEMIDAGVVPYLSRVLNSKIDWESKDKSVGAMKSRAAACRMLCCLFGIALTDDTGIGMRRLMDSVEADSRAYRASQSAGGKQQGPSDIIEAALSILQTSSQLSRRALMGTLAQGTHYQAALCELVDAGLLAAGSMCGSSVAPGGSEGTMVTGETFLASRNADDPYAGKRKAICRVACDVVVRGGRGGPSLLPAMLVGGFGEGSILSAMRLSLAIAQNGSKEEHAKLALSGILVPISDSLRAALSKGDLYRFSASLALVRFCGPHVAAGQGGGIESVRDTIRVATNVLTLPVNPDASIEQMETQDSLKSECIAALESLSRNASLWSAISTEALPSIVQYLHTSAGLKAAANSKRQTTRCTALRAVLQIVQVPSHAVSAAEAGIVDPLGKLLRTGNATAQEDEVSMLALEILHAIASNPQARAKAGFLSSGFARSICSALGKAATDEPKKPTDSRADVTFLGLQILLSILSDIENGIETQMVLQSQGAAAFIDAIASEKQFVRALCATLLLKTSMRLPRHDSDHSGELPFEIPRLYGPPLILVPEKCGGFDGTHEAAASILYTASVYACAVDSPKSDDFWKTVLVQDFQDQDSIECSRLAATLCAHFLSLLAVDYKAFVPVDPVKKQDYVLITRPLVRYRLLESLKDLMEDLSSQSTYGESSDPYVTSLLVGFNVPHICLSLWKDPAILDLAFELIKQIVEQDPDEVLHLFVEGKAAIMSLFDLLNLDASGVDTSKNIGEIRRFLASILGQLAENGLLTSAVERYDVRSSAIAALAAACLNEEERPQHTAGEEDDEDITSARLSTVLMRCLVDLCTVKDHSGNSGKRIRLSPSESEAIAKNLGKKICQMVLSRFLERAKLQQYQMEHDEDITEAPDVAMLCAIAQHDEALAVLRSIGGLHALSLVAAEGELSAMVALKKACNNDASVLLEGDTYKAVMGLLIDDSKDVDTTALLQLHASAFELLAQLCNGSVKGRSAVAAAESCTSCLEKARDIVSILTGDKEETKPEEESDVEAKDSDDDSDDNDSDEELEDSDEVAPPKPPSFPTAPPASTSDLAPPSYFELASNPAIKATLPVAPPQKTGPPRKEIDYKLELAISACAFISALVPTAACRDALLDDEFCLNSLSTLATKKVAKNETKINNDKLTYASLKALAALAPYTSSEGNLSAERLAEVLLTVLTSEKVKKMRAAPDGSLNINHMYNCAVNGVVVLLDSIPNDVQKTLAQAVAAHFKQSVKSCSVTRSTSKEFEKVYSAELAYSLSLVLVLIRGKEYVDEIFTSELLTSFIHLTQWRYDPKTSIGNTNQQAWDAAVSNSLQLLATLIWRPQTVLASQDINLKTLGGTTLMLARPGKAPRKAIDFKTVLERLASGQEAVSAQSAQRILGRLF